MINWSQIAEKKARKEEDIKEGMDNKSSKKILRTIKKRRKAISKKKMKLRKRKNFLQPLKNC